MTKESPRTLTQFKAQHDPDTVIPAKIQAGLAELRAIGKQHYEPITDFIRRIGLSQTYLGKYRQYFEANIVTASTPGKSREAGKTVTYVFGDAKVAAQARGEDSGSATAQ